MNSMILGMSALLLTGATISAGNASSIVSAGSYDANSFLTEFGSYSLSPGRYRFTLSTSTPVFNLNPDGQGTYQGITKQVSYNDFCDYDDGNGASYCGGNEDPFTYAFRQITSQLYVADIVVNEAYTEFYSNFYPLAFTNHYDVCCIYGLDATTVAAGSYQLSVSDVPEPATWALMIVGFGFVGAALRHKRHRQFTLASFQLAAGA